MSLTGVSQYMPGASVFQGTRFWPNALMAYSTANSPPHTYVQQARCFLSTRGKALPIATANVNLQSGLVQWDVRWLSRGAARRHG